MATVVEMECKKMCSALPTWATSTNVSRFEDQIDEDAATYFEPVPPRMSCFDVRQVFYEESDPSDVESQTSLLDFFDVLSCPQDTKYLDNTDNVLDCTASCTEVAGTYGHHEEHPQGEKSWISYGELGWRHPEKVGIDNTLIHKCIAYSDGGPPRAREFHPSPDLLQDVNYARYGDEASAHKDVIVVEQFDSVMQCAEPPTNMGTSLIYKSSLQGEDPGLNDEFNDLEAYSPTQKKRKKDYRGMDMSATRYILEEECRVHESFEQELADKLLLKGNKCKSWEIDMNMRYTEKELGRDTKRIHIIEEFVTDVDSFKPFEVQRELKTNNTSSNCHRTASAKDVILQSDLTSCAESVEGPVIGCEKLMSWYPVETTFDSEIFTNIFMHWVVDESLPYDVDIPHLEEVEISPTKFWRSNPFYEGEDLNCDSPRSSDSVQLFLNDSPTSSSEVKKKTSYNNRENNFPSSLTARSPSGGQDTKKNNDRDAKAGLAGLLPRLSSSTLTESPNNTKECQDTPEAVTRVQKLVKTDPYHELHNPVHIFSGAASKTPSQPKTICSEPEKKFSSEMNDAEEKTKSDQNSLSNISKNELPSRLRESVKRKLESCLEVLTAVEHVHKPICPITEMGGAEALENQDVKSGPVTPVFSEYDAKVKNKQPRSRTKKLKGTRVEQKLPIYTGSLISLKIERKIPTKETSEKKEAACETEGSVGCSEKEHESDCKVAGKTFEEETVPKKDSVPKRSSKYRGVTRHRHTGRFEAHLWDNSKVKSGLAKRGRQGAYKNEEQAAHAHDLAALKYWGPGVSINFPLRFYEEDLKAMECLTKEQSILHLRRRSPGFTRGCSKFRGVTRAYIRKVLFFDDDDQKHNANLMSSDQKSRHHQDGRWEARFGRDSENKYSYLGTFGTQEEAATAYDKAAVSCHGANALTNFDVANYLPKETTFLTISKASPKAHTSGRGENIPVSAPNFQQTVPILISGSALPQASSKDKGKMTEGHVSLKKVGVYAKANSKSVDWLSPDVLCRLPPGLGGMVANAYGAIKGKPISEPPKQLKGVS